MKIDPNLEAGGGIIVKRRSDGERLGQVQLIEGVWLAVRWSTSRYDEAAERREDRVVTGVEEGIAWIAENPAMPDPTAADPALTCVGVYMVRRIWTGPNGAFVGIVDKRARPVSESKVVAGLWTIGEQSPIARYFVKDEDGQWVIHGDMQKREYVRLENALETLAKHTLKDGASAHDRLAFASEKADRTELFRTMARRYGLVRHQATLSV